MSSTCCGCCGKYAEYSDSLLSDAQILHAGGVQTNQSDVLITNIDVYMNHFDQTFD